MVRGVHNSAPATQTRATENTEQFSQSTSSTECNFDIAFLAFLQGRPLQEIANLAISAKPKTPVVTLPVEPYHLGSFIPADLAINSFDDLAPYFAQLESRPLTTVQDVQQAIQDLSDILFVFYNNYVRTAVNYWHDTKNTDSKARFTLLTSDLEPKVKQAQGNLEQRFVASGLLSQITDPQLLRYAQGLSHKAQFNNEAIPEYEAQIDAQGNQVDQLVADLTISVDDKDVPVKKTNPYLQSSDRVVREQVWNDVQAAYLSVRGDLDTAYTQTIQASQALSTTAGFANYCDYMYARYLADYSPEQVSALRHAVAVYFGPLMKEMRMEQAKRLGLAPADYQPWDALALPAGIEPLVLFDAHDPASVETYLHHMTALADAMENPIVAQVFEQIVANRLYDFSGTRSGASALRLDTESASFLYANADGTPKTCLWIVPHELGHVIHNALMMDIPYFDGREIVSEVGDTMAFGLQLMMMEHWVDAGLLPADRIDQAKREHIEWFVGIMCWAALIDEYENWVYTNPTEATDVQTRDREFLELAGQFGFHDKNLDEVDWHADPELQALLSRIKQQRHTYDPSYQLRYFTTYGLSMVQAFRLYQSYRLDPQGTLNRFFAGQDLGNMVAPQEVFETMGLNFPLSDADFQDLAATLRSQIVTAE